MEQRAAARAQCSHWHADLGGVAEAEPGTLHRTPISIRDDSTIRARAGTLGTAPRRSTPGFLGATAGNGNETAKSRCIFRDFIEATAEVSLTKQEVLFRLQNRADNPLLLAAGFAKTDFKTPWLKRRTFRLVLG